MTKCKDIVAFDMSCDSYSRTCTHNSDIEHE